MSDANYTNDRVKLAKDDDPEVEKEQKFDLGELVATQGAIDEFTPEEHVACLKRHATGDWGNLDSEDRWHNDAALTRGERLLSAYVIRDKKLWIITEADRSSTTLLLPSEY